MKKYVWILLAAVMCLALTACGSESESEHEELLKMLDNGEYESAHYYIDNLKRQAEEEAESDEEKESLLPNLYGEWIVSSNYGNEDAFEKISFDEDGTCTIGDSSFRWRLNNEYENSFDVKISKDETIKYNVSISLSGKEPSLSLSEVLDDDSRKSIAEYKNLGLYEVIEITAENWDEYFEITEKGNFNKDAFGDFSSFYLSQYISLKEEYVDRVSTNLSDVVMELDFTYGKKGCQVDGANETYTLTDSYEVSEYDYDSSAYKLTYGSIDEEEYYRATIMSGSWNKENGYIDNYRTEPQVLRVQGSLYLLKEK